MIINPTKKSLALFNALVPVASKDNAVAFAEKNPFFSWHANYYNVNRKKILILVNDLTMTPVVLADINATNKKHLASYIEQGIRQAFQLSAVTSQQLDHYFELAGAYEINAGHNRRVIGVTNLYIDYTEAFPLNLAERLQPRLTAELADTPISKLPDVTSINAVQQVFSKKLALVPVTATDLISRDKAAYEITKTWDSFSKWHKYRDQGWFEQYEQVFNDLQANNLKLMIAFEDYLTNGERLSQKVVKRHVGNARFFVNEHLACDGFHTAVTELADVGEFFSRIARKDPWVTKNSLQQMAASLKKFYVFLERAGEISKEQLAETKEYIKEDCQITVFTLEEFSEGGSFYF